MTDIEVVESFKLTKVVSRRVTTTNPPNEDGPDMRDHYIATVVYDSKDGRLEVGSSPSCGDPSSTPNLMPRVPLADSHLVIRAMLDVREEAMRRLGVDHLADLLDWKKEVM